MPNNKLEYFTKELFSSADNFSDRSKTSCAAKTNILALGEFILSARLDPGFAAARLNFGVLYFGLY
jgi:hypothetical protein